MSSTWSQRVHPDDEIYVTRKLADPHALGKYNFSYSHQHKRENLEGLRKWITRIFFPHLLFRDSILSTRLDQINVFWH